MAADRYRWRIHLQLWDRNGLCFAKMWPQQRFADSKPPKEPPPADASGKIAWPQLPFAEFDKVGDARRQWMQLSDRNTPVVPKHAARAHLSAVRQYVERGSGWQDYGTLEGTHDVWLRGGPNLRDERSTQDVIAAAKQMLMPVRPADRVA